jgi:hypothetical protein
MSTFRDVPGADPIPFEFVTWRTVPVIAAKLREWLQQPDLTERQVYHMLQGGLLPGIHDGAVWTLRPHRLLEERRRREDAHLVAAAERRAAQVAAKKAGNGAPQELRRRGRPRRSKPATPPEGHASEPDAPEAGRG